MAATARKVRSSASTSARLSRTPEHRMPEHSVRPNMHVIVNPHYHSHAAIEHMTHFFAWAKSRSAPLLYVVVTVVFLVSALIGSLFLRTMMAENSFRSMQLQHEISVLQQDVDDSRAMLNSIEAQLPQRAESMGMIPQKGSITIDLQGYKSSAVQGVR